ncbi:MAG: HAD family hydrolase [Myxococcota bacterium]
MSPSSLPVVRAGLLFVDIDGTLVGPDGVHARVWPAFERLRAAGWGIGLCTGRPGSGEALALARRADPDGLHIFESGASVMRADGEVVASALLPTELLAAIVALGDAHGATVEAYTAAGRFLARERDELIARHEVLLGAGAELVPALDRLSGLVRIQWVVTHAAWPALRAAAKAGLGDVDVHEGRSPKMPDVVFAAVTARGVSKAWGIRRAAEHFGVPLARAAMVGDALNDVSAFRIVGRTYATADGVPGAQAEAQRLVPGPADGGVADAVADLLG